MPKAKETKVNKVKVLDEEFKTKAKEKIHQEIDRLSQMLSMAKAKFEKLDEEKKKKIIAGVAGSAALLAGAIGVGKLVKKAPKKNKK